MKGLVAIKKIPMVMQVQGSGAKTGCLFRKVSPAIDKIRKGKVGYCLAICLVQERALCPLSIRQGIRERGCIFAS
jgi:hypothetical protein